MKPEIKKKWLKALRSGQYKQCQSRLTDGKGFCCLGVLSNIYALETGQMWEWTTDVEGKKRLALCGHWSALPSRVQTWAGIGSANPSTPVDSAYGSSLAEHNDGGASFKDIAKIIERHL